MKIINPVGESDRVFYFCKVKQLAAICFILLFTLQIGIKSLVVAYYKTVDTQTAVENCEYKTITICKGNCYVAKKIKVISSRPGNDEHKVPSFDLSTFKDAVCLHTTLSYSTGVPARAFSLFPPVQEHYSFQPSFHLVKPPCA